MRQDATSLEPHLRPVFWLAESEGNAIGVSEVYRDIGSYDPERWSVEVSVLPEHRGVGHGSALYDTALDHLDGHTVSSITCRVHEADEVAVRFAQRRRYVETKRDFLSELSLAEVEPDPIEIEGISILSAEQIDSESFRIGLHGLFEEIRRDVPRTTPPTPLSLEFFLANILDHHLYSIPGTHVAMDGLELVGFTGSFRATEPGVIDQWLTGVRRQWRGKGIAKALKVAGIRWAKQAGFHTIRTDNDSRNAAMLAINNSLGFARKAGLIWMERRE
jgi:GNAT superfamily N-acetyltransferase